MPAPPFLSADECVEPGDFNAWFAHLGDRIAALESAGAVNTAGFLKADGSVDLTAPMVQTAPSTIATHLARFGDLPRKGKITVTGSATITVPAGEAILLSARSIDEKAYVFSHVADTVTVHVVDGAGTLSTTPTVVDWVNP
jgi:hypothetical protein